MNKTLAIIIAWVVGIITGLIGVTIVSLIAIWTDTPPLAGLGGVVAGMGAYMIGTLTYDKLR